MSINEAMNSSTIHSLKMPPIGSLSSLKTNKPKKTGRHSSCRCCFATFFHHVSHLFPLIAPPQGFTQILHLPKGLFWQSSPFSAPFDAACGEKYPDNFWLNDTNVLFKVNLEVRQANIRTAFCKHVFALWFEARLRRDLLVFPRKGVNSLLAGGLANDVTHGNISNLGKLLPNHHHQRHYFSILSTTSATPLCQWVLVVPPLPSAHQLIPLTTQFYVGPKKRKIPLFRPHLLPPSAFIKIFQSLSVFSAVSLAHFRRCVLFCWKKDEENKRRMRLGREWRPVKD